MCQVYNVSRVICQAYNECATCIVCHVSRVMCDVSELSPGEKYTVDNAQSAQGLDNNMQSVLEIKQVSHLVMMMMVMMMMMMMMMITTTQVTHTDWGVYTCRANNSMGEGEAMVVVKSKITHIFRSVRSSRTIFVGI